MGRKAVEDVLYQCFQARFLERDVRRLEPAPLPEGRISVDARSIVIARAMRHSADGRGDLCCPGPMAPGPALAFGATALEFLRHLARRGTSPAAARTGGLSWTDLRRGLIGWDGPPGMMTQVLAGAALAFAQRGEDRAALVFETESALDSGGWHEGMNLAAARRAPVIVVLAASKDGNGGHRSPIDGVARAYGVPAASVGGTPHDRLFALVVAARRRATVGGGPTLIALEWIGQDERWTSHEAFVGRALDEGWITERHLGAIKRAASAGVAHGLARMTREPGPEPREALAAVRTGSSPRRPWTRLKSPRPDGGDARPREVRMSAEASSVG